MRAYTTFSRIKDIISSLTFYDYLALAVLIIAVVPLFAYLAQPPIFIWDEAFYALSALDVHETGDLIVMRHNEHVTYLNTKPPFVIWLQALGITIFGANEYAIRFPSALAALVTCAMLIVFSKRTLGDVRIGIVSVLVLVTSYGYVRPHVARTGDLDSVLVMWITLYTLLTLHYLFVDPQRYKRIFNAIGIGVVAAFYTKSVAAFLMLPGLAIVAFQYKRLLPIVKKRYTYIVFSITIFVCLFYYALRELLSSGYLPLVFRSEYTRYTTNLMPWFDHGFDFYITNAIETDKFLPFLYALPVLIVAGLLDNQHRQQMLAFLILVLSYLLVISSAVVKLSWYDAPAYPLLALICGTGFLSLYRWVEAKVRLHRAAFPVLLVALFFWPFHQIHTRNAQRIGPGSALEAEGYTLREYLPQQQGPQSLKVLMIYNQYAHYVQAEFYINAFNRFKGHNIRLAFSPDVIAAGDTVLCCQDEHLQTLAQDWKLDTLYENSLESTMERPVRCTVVRVGLE